MKNWQSSKTSVKWLTCSWKVTWKIENLELFKLKKSSSSWKSLQSWKVFSEFEKFVRNWKVFWCWKILTEVEDHNGDLWNNEHCFQTSIGHSKLEFPTSMRTFQLQLEFSNFIKNFNGPFLTSLELSNFDSNLPTISFKFIFERLNNHFKFSSFLIFPTTLSNYMQP